MIIFSVKEFMDFTSKIIVERTSVCSRSSVKEQGKYYMSDMIIHVISMPLPIYIQYNGSFEFVTEKSLSLSLTDKSPTMY